MWSSSGTAPPRPRVARRARRASPWRARDLPRGRIARRLVEHQQREEVGDLLARQLPFHVLGHVRELARRHLLDVAAGDGLELAALRLQDDTLRVVFDEQPAEDRAPGRDDLRGPVAGADDKARVEYVREKLLEIAPAVAGDVGPDVGALA